MNKPVLKIMCILLVVLFTFSACSSEPPQKVLTQEEVDIVREENDYVIYGEDIGENMSVSAERMSLREFMMGTETVAYCEVIAEPYYVDANISNLFSNETQKPQMRVHKVKIISDAEGLLDKGMVVTFCYGLSGQADCPSPEVGDKIILTLRNGYEGSSADFYSSSFGYYYVTEKGNVISAFREDKDAIYSGQTVNNLLGIMKKTDEERIEYLAEKIEKYERSGGKYGYNSIEMLREQIKERIALRNSKAEK